MDFNIIPLMPEPLGIYSIPSDKHIEFKKIAIDILETANDDLRQKNQSSNNPLEHICNGKDQNIFLKFKQLNPLRLLLEKYKLNYICSRTCFKKTYFIFKYFVPKYDTKNKKTYE